MGFAIKNMALRGTGSFGSTMWAQPLPLQTFETYEDDGNTGDGRIDVSTVSGTLLGSIPINVQNTRWSKLRFENDRQGCRDITFELNRMPDFPIERFTKIKISIQGEDVWGGYVYSYPTEAFDKRQKLEFKGFGFRELLKKVKIKPMPGKYLYEIQRITESGVNIIIDLNAPVHEAVKVGDYFFVTEAFDSKNNGRYNVISTGGNQIVALRPNGVNQTIPQGLLTVIPSVWTNESALISDLVKQIVTEYCTNAKGISKSVSRIKDTTGILLGGRLDFDKMTVHQAFEKIRGILDGWYLWTDPNGLVVLSPDPPDLVDMIFAPEDCVFERDEDLDEIVNHVEVNRTKDRDDSTKSFGLAAWAEDPTSIKKWGILENEIDVPNYFDKPICQTIANNELTRKREPVERFTTKLASFRNWKFGKYKIVSPWGFYKEILTDLDSMAGFVVDAAITATLNDEVLVTGYKSLKLSVNPASSGKWIKIPIGKRFLRSKKIFLYVYSNKVGEFFSFGFGETSCEEHTIEIPSAQNVSFQRYQIEIEAANIEYLGEIGFRIDNAPVPVAGPNGGLEIYIDEVSIQSYGRKHSVTSLERVITIIEPHKRYCELEFGKPRTTLDSQLAGTMALVYTQRLALKDN
ncbi:hypothetical protein LEP1GSC165_0047 [Leptospira santarosai str. CBC523]|uniref:hypothetical protein n=1 Tax=Leptospira santarosai TaxID=28183 RepID=UPI0002BDC6A1|nr:hypothetical protein [Leptospira santarosai]EMO12508.1 hypothetical protein LEP1GSC165_0047 [Leptospira santarosai str. CBC523]